MEIFSLSPLACSGVPQDLTASNGTVTSPNYPNNYKSNSNCAWRIAVPDGFHISLTFKDFVLESHSRCNYDSVELRNGFNSTSPIIGKYCGSNIPPIAITSGRSLYVKFKTDGSGTRRGFKAIFTAVPNPSFNTSGEFSKND